ncbi:MAG: hypothetical protein B7Z16_12040 [Algoriphagus sp. 32-45-6]|nr:MAG: hypothetical protein B7Z16_12040 [Algoriphagus sp. 32-45-6]
MKTLAKLLPALAMVLAATLAMAMNFAPNPTERYAEDPDPDVEIWYDLTGISPGPSTYLCNSGPTVTCSRDMPDDSGDQIEAGIFVKNGNLPVAQP